MKFWVKLDLSILVMISVILSCSRFLIIRQNFTNSIERTASQSANQSMLERYHLESSMVDAIARGEEITNEKIIEAMQSLYLYVADNSEKVALYNQNHEKIFSNFDKIDVTPLEELFCQETDIYVLRKIENQHYLFFSSYWSINNEMIYIIHIYDVTAVYRERDRQMLDTIVADVIILGVSSIFISIFSLFLTRPIHQLNEASKKIASGQIHERVSVKSKDEIGELANSFNQMAGQIEHKINSLNLSIQQKSDFMNGFTHELKTPMTAIMGYADLLRFKKCDEEVTSKALNYIYSEAKRLEMLSHKLMCLMSLSEERIEPEKIVIHDFLEKMSQKIVLDKYELKLEIEPAIVKADKELLEVVIRNLVENSRKAEPKKEYILVRGNHISKDKYRILVIDTGKGIPKEHVERVTEDFYMVDKSRSRQNGGSGIGLSLCQKILEQHHTKLKIESVENEGTTVSFHLEVAANEN